MKEKALKAKTEATKAGEVLLALIVLVALTRSAIVTWYNDTDISGLPFDRIVSGIVLTLVFSYFVWLHYRKNK